MVFRVDPASILLISIEAGQSMLTVRREGQRWFSSEKPVSDFVIAPSLAVLAELHAEEAIEGELDRTRRPLLSIEVQEQKRIRMDFYAHSTMDSINILRTSLSPKLYVISRKATQVFQQLMSQLSLLQQVVASGPIDEPSPTPLANTITPTASPRIVATSRPVVSARRVQSSQPVKPRSVLPSSTSETSSERGKIEDEGVLTIHIVKSGETLWTIARQYNVTEEQVKQWNLLTTDVVPPGTELYVFAR